MKDKRMVSRSCSSFSFFEERWLRCNPKKNSDWLRRDDPSVLDPRRCLVRSNDFFLLFFVARFALRSNNAISLTLWFFYIYVSCWNREEKEEKWTRQRMKGSLWRKERERRRRKRFRFVFRITRISFLSFSSIILSCSFVFVKVWSVKKYWSKITGCWKKS